MPAEGPRVGVLAPDGSGCPDEILAAGGEPAPIALPVARPPGGVALRREWVADLSQVACSGEDLDALLLDDAEPAELAGMLAAALRLNLPAVVAAPLGSSFTWALAALGFAPLIGEPSGVAVEVARAGGPRPRELVEGFSLANALRAGLAMGAGAELLIHLAAIAREAGAVGFGQMIRVLSPETPALADPASPRPEAHGALARLALHDTRTVAGRLEEALPPAQDEPLPGGTGDRRLVFVRGRASGTEAVCRVSGPVAEVSGECRVFFSEKEAVRAVANGGVDPGALLVVAGCGPRGGPGLLRLDRLSYALVEAGLAGIVPVLTDGLAPDGAAGFWASLFAPEAAVGGVIGRLRDGDRLRLDLAGGRIRTGVEAGELARREPFETETFRTGYVGRYAASALPALEGAGFG